MPLPTGVYRADHVGSLLRPKEILQARSELPPDSFETAHLRPLEDKYIAESVRKQLKNGIRSITDGEYRRAYLHLDFLRELGGVDTEGMIVSTNETAGKHRGPPKVVITGKVEHVKPIQVDDFLFLEGEIKKCREEGLIGKDEVVTTKVAIPSPTMCHFRGGRDTVSLLFENSRFVTIQKSDRLPSY